ncbi:ankyrin repeat-containing domain protein [Massariosphaeria phaeospora]|uniref:Ankyrin repeat-containing domain protein n=1 Tax=Massariosphaeria phaeospora TaxID=100035 RepID=A0A7C8M8X0_9PLEO|nr:ankyrin repeat-containing domain protein [Massariosphaeria phaeospora]
MDPLSIATIASTFITGIGLLNRQLDSLNTLLPERTRLLKGFGDALDSAQQLQHAVKAQNYVDPTLLRLVSYVDELVRRLQELDMRLYKSAPAIEHSRSSLLHFSRSSSSERFKIHLGRRSSQTKSSQASHSPTRTKSKDDEESPFDAQIEASLGLSAWCLGLLTDLFKLRSDPSTEAFNSPALSATKRRTPPLRTAHDQTTASSTSLSSTLSQKSERFDTSQIPVYECRYNRYRKAADDRLSGSQSWFLSQEQYRLWRKEKPRLLWMEGVPGIGKSTIVSKIIDELSRESETVFAYYFMGYGMVQSARDVVQDLLRQLHVRLKISEVTQPQPSLKDQLARLEDLNRQRIEQGLCAPTVFLDGWEPRNMADLKSFERIAIELVRLEWRVFITSRSPPDAHFGGSHGVPKDILHFNIHAQDNKAAITSYVQRRLRDHPSISKLLALSQRLDQDIVDHVVASSQGLFFWVDILLGLIMRQGTVQGIRDVVKDLPVEPDKIIGNALEVVESQRDKPSRIARTAMIWLAIVDGPLHKDGLCEALALYFHRDDHWTTIDKECVPTAEYVKECCKSLITIDVGSSTVQLAHAGLASAIRNRWESSFPSEEKQLAMVCLDYLQFKDFESGPCDDEEALRIRCNQRPFFKIAASSWWRLRNPNQWGSPKLQKLAHKFFQSRKNLHAAMQLVRIPGESWTRASYPQFLPPAYINSMSPLQIAARLSLGRICEVLLEHSEDPILPDRYGRTPLLEACDNEDPDLFERLLRQAFLNCLRGDTEKTRTANEISIHSDDVAPRTGISPNLPEDKPLENETSPQSPKATDPRAQKPFPVLKQLEGWSKIESFYNKMSEQPKTISEAIEGNNIVGLLFLLHRNSPQTPLRDNTGKLHLELALARRSETAVQALLLYDADANETHSNKGTALHFAIQEYMPRIVNNGAASEEALEELLRVLKLLLAHGASINAKDSQQRMPIHLAVLNGARSPQMQHIQPCTTRVKVLDLLIKHGANLNGCEKHRSRSPSAVGRIDRDRPRTVDGERLGRVESLITFSTHLTTESRRPREATITEIPTPLCEAVKLDCFVFVERLLNAGADPDLGPIDQIPLCHATTGRGHNSLKITRHLLINGADPDVRCSSKWSPLHEATKTRDREMVELLLRYGANVNCQDANDRTPLIYAIQNCDESLVRLLIQSGADVDILDSDGRPALHTAAACGDQGIFTRIFVSSQGDASVGDRAGRTALDCARQTGEAGIIRILEAAAASAESKDEAQKNEEGNARFRERERVIETLSHGWVQRWEEQGQVATWVEP